MNLNELYENARAKWRDLTESPVPVIYLGTASCGRASGAMQTLDAIQKTLAENHLEVRVVQVGCIGPCYLEPLMDIALPGMPRVSYANVTPRKARTILESVLLKGDFISKLAVGYLGTEGVISRVKITHHSRVQNHPPLRRWIHSDWFVLIKLLNRVGAPTAS